LEYRTQFAWALYQDGDYQRAIEEASHILEKSPNLSAVYRLRALANVEVKNTSEALKDITRAIALDSSKPRYYGTRAYVHFLLGDLHNAILDSARCNDLLEEVDTLSVDENDPESKFIVETINSHFTSLVYPQLKSNGEILVQYWRSFLAWGRETKQVMLNGTTHKQENGTIGLGYVCLTDQNLRIISLGKPSELIERERKNSKRGIGSILFGPLRELLDKTGVSTIDQNWVIPNNTLQGAQLLTDAFLMEDKPLLFVKTPLTTFEILTASMDELNVAISMAITGKLTEIWPHKDSSSGAAREDVIRLLKELGELKTQGIITESEFEEKKKELLSRI
jgi:hypothetical protein